MADKYPTGALAVIDFDAADVEGQPMTRKGSLAGLCHGRATS